MATKHGDLLSGRIGDKIYYAVGGKQRVRSVSAHVANPRTDVQQSHRCNFIDIVRLSSHMKEAFTIGLHYIARRKGKEPYLYFRSINNDCCTHDGQIDYPRIILSYGSVARVGITSVKTQTVKRSGNQTITVTFDPYLNFSKADPDDEFYLYAYCPILGTGTLFRPVPRKSGTITVTLPTEWSHLEASIPDAEHTNTNSLTHSSNNTIHLYAFLRYPGPNPLIPEDEQPSTKARRDQTSPTIYIPLP
jgi:hypothetical protein